MKRCSSCGVLKDPGGFYKNRTARDGFTSRCRKCCRRENAEYKRRKLLGVAHEPRQRVCRHCGDVFMSEWTGKRRASVCSQDCRDALARATKEREREYRKEYDARRAYRRPTVCAACNSHFTATRRGKLHCSERCSLRDSWFRKKYGMSVKEVGSLIVSQSGLCAMCGDQLMNPQVDHCHDTGVVRGVLCVACNVGLGHYERLSETAPTYLVRFDLRDFCLA